MYQVKIKIIGISPLRMNNFLEAKQTTGTSRKLSKEERVQDAYDRAYKDKDDKYCVQKKAIKACIVNGGKRVKIGRASASASLRAIFHLDKENIILPKISKAEIVSEVVRIPPKTGPRVIQYYVLFKEWNLEFTATLVDDRFPENAIRDSVIEAGMYYGLLDGRPDYGRFVLESFEKIK